MSGTSEVPPGRGPRLGARRRSGILLHPTSLPGPGGIGDIDIYDVDFVPIAGRGRGARLDHRLSMPSALHCCQTR